MLMSGTGVSIPAEQKCRVIRGMGSAGVRSDTESSLMRDNAGRREAGLWVGSTDAVGEVLSSSRLIQDTLVGSCTDSVSRRAERTSRGTEGIDGWSELVILEG